MAIKAIPREKELLDAAATGSEAAFAELFYAYHQQLGEYVQTLTDSPELSQEIVQDVFVKVWLQRESLPEVERFTAYLFILTRNYTLNCIRKMVREEKMHKEYSHELMLAEANDWGEETLLSNTYDQQLLDRAIAQLPPQQQRVFMLRRQGLKNPEIARQMNISTDSVKKYQQWALKAVSEFVRAHAALSLLIFMKHLS